MQVYGFARIRVCSKNERAAYSRFRWQEKPAYCVPAEGRLMKVLMDGNSKGILPSPRAKTFPFSRKSVTETRSVASRRVRERKIC